MTATIWTMLSPKGGAGKTTLALVLAGELSIRGQKVTIIDADKNKPMVKWFSKDQGPENITVIEDNNDDGSTITDIVDKAALTSDIVIIDTEGTNNVRANTAVQISDLIIIPIQSATPDMLLGIEANEYVNRASRVVRREIPRMIVRTLIDPAIEDREEKIVATMLKNENIPQAEHRLMRRSAFKSLQTLGTTLHTFDEGEAAGLPKAKANANAVFESVLMRYAEITAQQKTAKVGG